MPIIETLVGGGIIGALGKVIDKIFPDPAEKAKAQIALLQAQQAGEFKQIETDLALAIGQMEVNKVEASTDLFRGGWRPFVGWICGLGLAFQFLGRPMLTWIGPLLNLPDAPPELDMGTLLTLLLGMLGLGGMRTYERVSGSVPPGK